MAIIVLGIDPGPKQSAFVIWDGSIIRHKGILDNDDRIPVLMLLSYYYISSGQACPCPFYIMTSLSLLYDIQHIYWRPIEIIKLSMVKTEGMGNKFF